MSSSQGLPGPNGIPAALWNMPALAPPPGQIPNFDHPINKDAELIAMNSVFLALMLLSVAIRFINSKDKKFSWDKVMCLIAVMSSISYSATMLSSQSSCSESNTITHRSGLQIGFGRHLWEIRAVTITRENVLRMIQISCLYIISVGFAKLSVLFLYLRFFKVIPTSRALIWFGIAFTIASSFTFLGIEIFQATQCITLERFATASFCTKMSLVVVIQAGTNVFLDFYILVIPLQQVVKLNLTLRKKLGVVALFGIGFTACVVSVIRLAFTIIHMDEEDQFWFAVLTTEPSIVEINVVIIAPCLLFLPAFIKTSKSSLYSLRTRIRSRSRLTSSIKSSLHDRDSFDKKTIVRIQVQVQQQESPELKFLTEADDHLVPTNGNGQRRENGVPPV
ncbi:hypothetical protein IQ07DRAFT_650025 [Pyrenochaeta sp. DS3sAY3a]|nr:hypothetical protein IQ07DRAFT_650025 [Pyrenochaeta sp. DS3sAY3a]